MANHFPVMPGDLQLSTLNYVAEFPTVVPLTSSSPFYFGAQVTSNLLTVFQAGAWGMSFVFPAPGNVGTFDQDAVETAMKSWLTSVCQAISISSGEPLTTVQAAIKVNRQWSWIDASGFQLTYTDTMVYP